MMYTKARDQAPVGRQVDGSNNIIPNNVIHGVALPSGWINVVDPNLAQTNSRLRRASRPVGSSPLVTPGVRDSVTAVAAYNHRQPCPPTPP